MARVIGVGEKCIIAAGALQGKEATIVAYDVLKDEVKLVIDSNYTIVTRSINIKQDYVEKLKNALEEIKRDLMSIDMPTDFDSYINSDLELINEVLNSNKH